MFIEFKPGQKYPGKNAEISDSMNGFTDCGRIIEPGEIVVDIDDLNTKQIEALISNFGIKTEYYKTDRGIHLVYKSEGKEYSNFEHICSLGFKVEIKTPGNSRENDIPFSHTVKRNGIARECYNKGNREPISDMFILRSPKGEFKELLGYDDGDGRNQALFDRNLSLIGFRDRYRILKYINQYIFSEPLSENEFETVAREVELKADKGNEQPLAEHFVNAWNVVEYEEDIYFRNKEIESKKECVYYDKVSNGYKNLERNIIRELEGNPSTHYIREIAKKVELLSEKKLNPDGNDWRIKFKNGFIQKGEFVGIVEDDFSIYSIPVDYKPDKEPVEVVDNYLNDVTGGDSEYKKLILQMIASCFITNHSVKSALGKFFIIHGPGKNGKGTLMKVISKLVHGYKSTLTPSQFKDEKYLCNLKDTLVNLGDDISGDKSVSTIGSEVSGQLKRITTADEIELRELYKSSDSNVVTPTLIFTTNHHLYFTEKNDGINRRQMWLPFPTKIEKRISRLEEKLTTIEAMEYWYKLIIEQYEQLYKNLEDCKENIYDIPDVVADYTAEIIENSNNTMMFLSDYEASDIEGLKPPELYGEYEIWAEDNGYNTGGKTTLADSVFKMFNLKSKAKKVGGKTKRIYCKID